MLSKVYYRFYAVSYQKCTVGVKGLTIKKISWIERNRKNLLTRKFFTRFIFNAKISRSTVQGEGTKKDPIVLDEVKGRQRPPKRGGARPQAKTNAHGAAAKPQCKRCSQERHQPDKCPAKSVTCHKCNRKGHFSVQCFSKTTAAATHELSLDMAFLGMAFLGMAFLGMAFLGMVTSAQEPSWTTTLLLGNRQITFKFDRG